MLINELPDDCLLTIFDYIQDLEDLINCFKVCEKWSNVIVGRTKRFKYLIDKWYYPPDQYCNHVDRPVTVGPTKRVKYLINYRNCSPLYFCNYVSRPVDVTCLSKLFPNLRIADLTFLSHEKIPIEDVAKLIRDSESLKGIIYNTYLDFEWKLAYANLEMLSANCIDSSIKGIYENVKQLHLWTCDFKRVAHSLPNLERLRIWNLEEYYSDVPVLAKLKIVEINLNLSCGTFARCSLVFMDSCPALQSAHIIISCRRIVFNDSIKHSNLRDLVLRFTNSILWNDVRRLLSKYPNLKHLAIRGIRLKDEDIKQLILIVPKLTLIDIRESRGVTQEANNYVQDYCKQYGRSIKFYYKKDDKQIGSDWPQLLNQADKICRGFDFMEHCFFKDFGFLPLFLEPIDD